jgi:hypothetical protein
MTRAVTEDLATLAAVIDAQPDAEGVPREDRDHLLDCLSDALEEAGGGLLAAGVRRLRRYGRWPYDMAPEGGFVWFDSGRDGVPPVTLPHSNHWVCRRTYQLLGGVLYAMNYKAFPTRTAAVLALAEAYLGIETTK